MTYQQLLQKTGQQCKDARAINYMVKTIGFKILWASATNKQEIVEALNDISKLRALIRAKNYTVAELRQIASQYNIPYYSHMRKAELLAEIKYARRPR